VTDPATLEVANLASEADLSFLNADPESLEVTPPQEPEPAPAEVTTTAIEPEKPTVTPVTPEIPAHPQILLDAARAAGIDERYLAPGVVDTNALTDFVVKMRLQEQPKAAPVEVEEDDEAILNYVENDLGADKKLVSHLRRQNKTVKALLERDAAREKQFKDIEANQTRRHQMAIKQAIDDAVDSLGEKFEVVLGKGPIDALTDKDAIKERASIFRDAEIDVANDTPAVAAKKYAAEVKRRHKILVAQAAPVQTPPPAKNGKPAPTADEWANAGLSRPSGTIPKASKGEKAAREHIQEFLRDRVSATNGDDYDGIPN
jgi:hypothetical protein